MKNKHCVDSSASDLNTHQKDELERLLEEFEHTCIRSVQYSTAGITSSLGKVSGLNDFLQSLPASTGALTTNISMDYRRARGYTVVLLCRDTGGLTNTSTVYVTISRCLQ